MSAPERSRRRAWLAAILVLGFLVTIRIVGLDRDPPAQILPHYFDEAHFRDEAAKAHEARNMAVFGAWQLSEFDEYGFWRLQSPYWVYAESAWFSVFGVGVLAARAFVLAHVLLSLALLFWLALVRHGLTAAIVCTLLLGANWGFLSLSRLGLMEGVLIAWLIVATAGLAQLERRPEQAGRWIAVAVGGFGLACLTKQTALLLIPPFVGILIWLALRAAGSGSLRERFARRAPGFAFVGVTALVAGLAILFFDPEYQERLAFNAKHFTSAEEADASVGRNAVLAFVYGLGGRRMQVLFMVLAPLPLWLATTELVRLLVVARDRRRAGQGWIETTRDDARRASGLTAGPAIIDLWMLAWALLGLAANLASPHRAIRFALILLPPAAWLGALLFARAWAHPWPARWRRRVQAGLLALMIGSGSVTVARIGNWLNTSESTAAELGGELEAIIGDRHAVVVGEFAAQAVFETPYWHFYVRRNQFNESPEVIRALGITHMVIITVADEDFVEDLMVKRTPELLEGRRRIGTLRFREHELAVWELSAASAE